MGGHTFDLHMNQILDTIKKYNKHCYIMLTLPLLLEISVGEVIACNISGGRGSRSMGRGVGHRRYVLKTFNKAFRMYLLCLMSSNGHEGTMEGDISELFGPHCMLSKLQTFSFILACYV